jgi:hypothetical protein
MAFRRKQAELDFIESIIKDKERELNEANRHDDGNDEDSHLEEMQKRQSKR